MDQSTRWVVTAAIAMGVSIALRLIGTWVESRQRAATRVLVAKYEAQASEKSPNL